MAKSADGRGRRRDAVYPNGEVRPGSGSKYTAAAILPPEPGRRPDHAGSNDLGWVVAGAPIDLHAPLDGTDRTQAMEGRDR
jgi:hypothetical protein